MRPEAERRLRPPRGCDCGSESSPLAARAAETEREADFACLVATDFAIRVLPRIRRKSVERFRDMGLCFRAGRAASSSSELGVEEFSFSFSDAVSMDESDS